MMPTDGGKVGRGRASPTMSPKGSRTEPSSITTGDGEGSPTTHRHNTSIGGSNTGAIPRLKPSASASTASPVSHAILRGPEPLTPGTSQVLSPVGSPLSAPSPSAQESVSVVVRLRGCAAPFATQLSPRGGERLHSPASLVSSPLSAPQLQYAVADGTLKTPRTGRRLASRSSGAITPRPPLDASPGNSDMWQQQQQQQSSPQEHEQEQRQQGQSSALLSPLMSGEGGAAVAFASPTTTPLLAATLPKPLAASATTSAAAAAAATPPSARPLADSLRASPCGASTASPYAGPPLVSPHLLPSGGCIGSRGRLLTIHSPTSEDTRQYEVGEVFEPDVSNAVFCSRMLPAIMQQLRAGYNACVLCYGQTGSGKTHTMNALVPTVATELFRTLDAHNEVVEISLVQIYNNKAYNLLDGPRAGRLGAELSKPSQASGVDNGSGTCGALEPKVLVRSAAEVQARLRVASRMRVTHAHALNPRSSRSFTLLTLHVTRFLDGAPLTTTRVTLADLAGTERLKKSGATGEGQSQAIFINKSLMALRELVEASGTEAEVLHYRDALLTTYLAPRLRSWHLFLLVTVTLDAASYDETKSSLDFATNAQRRRIKKVRCRTADRLSGATLRFSGAQSLTSSGRGGSGFGRAEADVAELQSVVEALHHRIRFLEESLKVAQRQRRVLEQLCTPAASPRSGKTAPTGTSSGDVHGTPPPSTNEDDEEAAEEEAAEEGEDGAGPTSSARLRQSEAHIRKLRAECVQYRQLLREREEDLHCVQAQSAPEGADEGSLLESTSSAHEMNGTYETQQQQQRLQQPSAGRPQHPHNSFQFENREASDEFAGEQPQPQPQPALQQQQQQQQQQLPSSHSSLSASMLSGDAPAPASSAAAANSSDEAPSCATAGMAEGAHAQLLQGLLHLSRRMPAAAEDGAAWEQLYDAALRATEQHDDVRERLLVVTASLRGLRAQNYTLHDSLLRANRSAVAQEERHRHHAALLARAGLRAGVAEAAVEELRLHLFRAYAEQPIIEEVTRLYLDEPPQPTDAADTLSGTQLAEHREEMEKFETHQRALQDKITELVNTVEQLSRAGQQKDVALAAMESIITPAQRALFHAMSTTRNDSDEVLRQTFPREASGAESAADCFSLLQSRVSELELLLQQERQLHLSTSAEVREAREDARRSRQEQRQAVFQQQEEERRVAQLTAENFDLRQQSERHQVYLDQVHVHFQEQLLELRRYHVLEMAEQRRLLEEAQQQQRELEQQRAQESDRRDGAVTAENEADEEGENDGDDGRGFCQTSTRRGTSRGPLHTSHDWTGEDTARGWPSGSSPPPPPSAAAAASSSNRRHTMMDDWKRSNSTTLPQPPQAHTPKAEKQQSSTTTGLRGKGKRVTKRHTKKSRGKSSETRTRRGSSATSTAAAAKSPPSGPSSRVRASAGGRRPTVRLDSTQPPPTPSRTSAERTRM